MGKSKLNDAATQRKADRRKERQHVNQKRKDAKEGRTIAECTGCGWGIFWVAVNLATEKGPSAHRPSFLMKHTAQIHQIEGRQQNKHTMASVCGIHRCSRFEGVRAAQVVWAVAYYLAMSGPAQISPARRAVSTRHLRTQHSVQRVMQRGESALAFLCKESVFCGDESAFLYEESSHQLSSERQLRHRELKPQQSHRATRLRFGFVVLSRTSQLHFSSIFNPLLASVRRFEAVARCALCTMLDAVC